MIGYPCASGAWNVCALLDFENIEVLPLFFFDRMISSNNRMAGSSLRFISRSCMNSLKAVSQRQHQALRHCAETGFTLSFSEHLDVSRCLVRHAVEEAVHIEAISWALFLAFTNRLYMLSIRKQQTGKATDKRGPDLVSMEGDRARKADLLYAATVKNCVATCQRLARERASVQLSVLPEHLSPASSTFSSQREQTTLNSGSLD